MKIAALILVSFCSLAAAQEPKLDPVFNDDFSKDTRADYTVKGDVEWKAGRINLSPNASLNRKVGQSQWARVRLNLACPKLSEQNPVSEVRVWFILEGPINCYIRLRRELKAGRISGSAALVATREVEGKPLLQELLRQSDWEPTDTSLTVEYRSGLVSVNSSAPVLLAYIWAGNAGVVGLTISSMNGRHSVSELNVSHLPGREQELNETQKRLLAEADMKAEKLRKLFAQAKYSEAATLGEEVCKTQAALLGELHPKHTQTLGNVAAVYIEKGDFVHGDHLYSQFLAIQEKALGKQHPTYAIDLINVANLARTMGNYDRAIQLSVQAQDTWKKVQPEQHAVYARMLQALGLAYEAKGDYAKALPLITRFTEIHKKSFGEQNAGYADGLLQLGGLYSSMGDTANAESLLRKSVEIRKDMPGLSHAFALRDLAALYVKTGDLERAERLFLQTQDRFKSLLSEDHPEYATSVHNLAVVLGKTEKYVDAERLLQKSQDIWKQAYGERHPRYADSLALQARFNFESRNFDQAESLYEQARVLKDATIGTHHPDCADILDSLALIYRLRRDFESAEPLAARSLRTSMEHLEKTSVVLSERQQLAMNQMLRNSLDRYVSLALDSDKYHAAAARYCLLWKGATLVRQRAMRLAGDQPSIAVRFQKLQQVTRQLAALSRAIPGQGLDQWKLKITNLTNQKEQMEAELSRESAEFRSAMQRVTFEQIQQAIPKDGALVDFLQFQRGVVVKDHWKTTSNILAVVVRANEEPQLIDLGLVAPLSEAIDTWRETFGMSPQGRKAGNDIRKQIWTPLLEHIGDAKTVLVSTDGVLGRMPLAALPGKQPGTYLIEDHRLAMIPVPQLLPAVVNDLGKNALSRELLLMGDVDYDKATDKREKRNRKKRGTGADGSHMMEAAFGPLPGTAGEVEDLQTLHVNVFKGNSDDVITLKQAGATESRFRELAGQYRHLHLATHGFFAAARHKSALANDTQRSGSDQGLLVNGDQDVTGWNPGLLSGLAFAGANLEPEPGQDDGILTSQEIAFLPLNGVDTVVLSACETGLGQVAGGEGLIGIQRAFQIAGVRSTVASYWKVDDQVTRRLMERFYRNVWEKKMPRLDALRAAQLEVMKDPAHPSLPRGIVAKLKKPTGKNESNQRTNPKYWAAFQLSGDWR